MRSTNPSLKLAKGFPIVLEVSHLSRTDVDMLYSLIEIWLNRHCKSEWNIEEIEESRKEDHRVHTYIRIVFTDPREAVFCKLSPLYLKTQPDLPMLVEFFTTDV